MSNVTYNPSHSSKITSIILVFVRKYPSPYSFSPVSSTSDKSDIPPVETNTVVTATQWAKIATSSGAFLDKTLFLEISRFLDAVHASSMLHVLRNLISIIFLILQNSFILSRSWEKKFNVNGQNFTFGFLEYCLGRQYFRAEYKLFHLRLDT